MFEKTEAEKLMRPVRKLTIYYLACVLKVNYLAIIKVRKFRA